MSKISFFFLMIRYFITDTGEMFKTLYRKVIEINSRKLVTNKYGLTKGLKTVDITELIPEMNASIESYTYLDGASRITDIALLKTLAKRFDNCQFLEIGTLRGETIFNISKVAGKCVSLSLSKEEMKLFGVDQHSIDITRMFLKGVGNIEQIEHNSHTFDFSAYEGKFDMVFIDGDHSTKGVKIDTANAFRLLKDENSVIVWHDYGKSYEDVNWEVLAGMLQGCPGKKERERLYKVSNSICAIYTNQPVEAGFPRPRKPTKLFDVDIRIRKMQEEEAKV